MYKTFILPLFCIVFYMPQFVGAAWSCVLNSRVVGLVNRQDY